MTFEIKKGVPVPRAARRLYPFDDMEVGDCFDAPDDMGVNIGGDNARQNSISASARQPRLKGKVFTTRRIKAEGIIRCWRVK